MKVRNRLKFLLHKEGISLLALANKADVNYGTLYNFYHERYNIFNGNLIGKVCKALGCQVHDLIYIEDNEANKKAGA